MDKSNNDSLKPKGKIKENKKSLLESIRWMGKQKNKKTGNSFSQAGNDARRHSLDHRQLGVDSSHRGGSVRVRKTSSSTTDARSLASTFTFDDRNNNQEKDHQSWTQKHNAPTSLPCLFEQNITSIDPSSEDCSHTPSNNGESNKLPDNDNNELSTNQKSVSIQILSNETDNQVEVDQEQTYDCNSTEDDKEDQQLSKSESDSQTEITKDATCEPAQLSMSDTNITILPEHLQNKNSKGRRLSLNFKMNDRDNLLQSIRNLNESEKKEKKSAFRRVTRKSFSMLRNINSEQEEIEQQRKLIHSEINKIYLKELSQDQATSEETSSSNEADATNYDNSAKAVSLQPSTSIHAEKSISQDDSSVKSSTEPVSYNRRPSATFNLGHIKPDFGKISVSTPESTEQQKIKEIKQQRQQQLTTMQSQIQMQKRDLEAVLFQIEQQKAELAEQSKQLQLQQEMIAKQQKKIAQQKLNLDDQQHKISKHLDAITRQKSQIAELQKKGFKVSAADLENHNKKKFVHAILADHLKSKQQKMTQKPTKKSKLERSESKKAMASSAINPVQKLSVNTKKKNRKSKTWLDPAISNELDFLGSTPPLHFAIDTEESKQKANSLENCKLLFEKKPTKVTVISDTFDCDQIPLTNEVSISKKRWWQHLQVYGTAFCLGSINYDKRYEIAAFVNNCCSTKCEILNSKLQEIEDLQGRVSSIACGMNTMALISNVGELHIRGAEELCEVMLGSTTTMNDSWKGTFTIDKLVGRRVKKVACGPFHFAAIAGEELVLWGLNVTVPSPAQHEQNVLTKKESYIINGQVNNKTQQVCIPMVIHGLRGKLIDVACGWSFTMVLTTNGVYSVGSNGLSQLGRSGDCTTLGYVAFPERYNVIQIACGDNHTLAVTDGGSLFSWGNNHNGQLGIGLKSGCIGSPMKIAQLSEVVQASCGSSHSAAITAKGKLFTWGFNAFGQLGISKVSNTYRVETSPMVVEYFLNSEPRHWVRQVDCGPFTTACVTDHGEAFIWGLLSAPNLSQHQPMPRKMLFPFKIFDEDAEHFVAKVACGATHTLFLTDKTVTFAMAAMTIACQRPPINLKELKNQFLQIPDGLIKILLHRVLQQISKSGVATQKLPKLSSLALPFITCDKATLHYFPAASKWQDQLTLPKRILLTRHSSEERVSVGIILENKGFISSDCTLHTNSQLKFDKTQFGGQLKVTLKCTKVPSETQYSLLTLKVHYSKSKYAVEALTSYYYVLCIIHSDKEEDLALQNEEFEREESVADVDDDEAMHASNGLNKHTKKQQLVNTMATYVPNILLRQFSAVSQGYGKRVALPPPEVPAIDKFAAAILFIDISGFTSLNERLASLGSAGPELVSRHINSYFGSLILAVYEHGGDVLKFAGDALICMFGDPDNTYALEDNALKAIQCGIEIQTRLAAYDSSEGFRLTLHIGIGCGDLFSLYVGGFQGHWEYLVSGEPLAQLRTAVDNSHEGEVVISKECWELINSRIISEPRGDDFWIKSVIAPVSAAEAQAQFSLRESCCVTKDEIEEEVESGTETETETETETDTEAELRQYHANTSFVEAEEEQDIEREEEKEEKQAFTEPPKSPSSPIKTELHLNLQKVNTTKDENEATTTHSIREVSKEQERRASLGDNSNQVQASKIVNEIIEAQLSARSYSSIANISPQKQNNVRAGIPIEMEHALRCFIPEAVLVKLDSMQLGWMDELRTATILFVKLNDFDCKIMNASDYCKQINSILVAMQKVIFKYEGMVRQFLSDDKGTVLIAAFGIPDSHDNDPVRGVRAAIQIHASLRALEIECTIGVTTGRVYCGSVGSTARQEYAMVGDIVNLSARLMVAAGKQGEKILCDHATFKGSEEFVCYKELAPIRVKGKSQLIHIYSPSFDGIRRPIFPKGVLVGRQKEISQVDRAISLLQGGFPSSILVEGAEGTGKSHLVGYAVATAQKNADAKILTLVADPMNKLKDFHAWKLAVIDLLGFSTNFDDEEAKTVVTKLQKDLCVTNDWLRLAPLLATILPELAAHLPENDTTSKLNAKAKHAQLEKLLKYLLQQYQFLHQVPLAIVFDNVHSSDYCSLRAVVNLQKGAPRSMLFVIASRPFRASSANEAYKELLQLSQKNKSNFTLIKLRPLSPAHCIKFTQAIFDVSSLPESLINFIKLACDDLSGNPLFIKGLTEALISSGAVQIVEDDPKRIELNLDFKDSQAMPNVIHSIINSNIDRLDAAKQMLLKVASVIGKEFSLHLLKVIYPIEHEYLECELEYLQSVTELVALKRKTSRDITYVFCTTTVQEVAYSRMLFSQRKQLHFKIAAYFAKKASAKRPELYEVIAYHYEKMVELEVNNLLSAPIATKAIKYLILYGNHALTKRAKATALSCFNRARALVNALPESDSKSSQVGKLDALIQQVS